MLVLSQRWSLRWEASSHPDGGEMSGATEDWGITVFGGPRGRRHRFKEELPQDPIVRSICVFKSVCGKWIFADHEKTMLYEPCKRCL